MRKHRSDIRWDEYHCTDIDPCGYEEEEYTISAARRNRKISKREEKAGCIIWLFSALLLVSAITFVRIKENLENRRKQETEVNEKTESMQLLTPTYPAYHTDTANDIVVDTTCVFKTQTTSVIDKESAATNIIIQSKPRKQREYTQYEQGYWDGYECGYDDADQNAGYGYSFYTDGKSEEYIEGFYKAYPKGYAEGIEDYEAFNDEY